jgi:hypothetical protein
MNHRESIHNIRDNYSLWKKTIESEYSLLGLADDVFVSPVKYYFSPKGFGLILSRDMIIICGNDRNKSRNEVLRLEKTKEMRK